MAHHQQRSLWRSWWKRRQASTAATRPCSSFPGLAFDEVPCQPQGPAGGCDRSSSTAAILEVLGWLECWVNDISDEYALIGLLQVPSTFSKTTW